MIVLFEDGRASLLLSGVKRDSEGKIKTGFVENGLWDFLIKGEEVLSKDGKFIVTRQPIPDYFEMEIPKEVKGDYNVVMRWAQKQYDKSLSTDTSP